MKKNGKILVALVAVVAVVAVIGAAILLTAMPNLAFVKEGDYVLFDVSVDTAFSGHFEGTANMTFANVTGHGCDVRTEFNVPGWVFQNTSSHLDKLTALTTSEEIGTLNESHLQLSTALGVKNVNLYTKLVDGVYWYSWCGTDPLVQYKIVVTQPYVDTTFTIHSTNVDSVRTGNAWAG